MKILLAVDLHTDATEVVQHAQPWITRLGAVADLVFVDTYRATILQFLPTGFEEELERLDRDTARRMDALLELLPRESRGRALVDTTGLDRMVQARGRDYGLVMVGTRARVGFSHLWAGSGAERIVRFSPVSVLVLRDRALQEPVRILLALDLAEDVEPLVGAVAPIAARLGAPVDLLTVHDVPRMAAFPEAPGLYAALARHAEDARGEMTHRLEALLRDRFPPENQGIAYVDDGPAVLGILERAPGSDLVVVGTHARDGSAHAGIGAVAERVLRRSDRPVLVLRA